VTTSDIDHIGFSEPVARAPAPPFRLAYPDRNRGIERHKTLFGRIFADSSLDSAGSAA